MIWRALLFLVSASICFGETTQTNSLAQIEGRVLAHEILAQRPNTNSVLVGLLKIRATKGGLSLIPVKFEIFVREIDWQNTYSFEIRRPFPNGEWEITSNKLVITHTVFGTNQYQVVGHTGGYFGPNLGSSDHNFGIDFHQSGDGLMERFAESDFSFADLGLEFLHWPEQKVLKHEMRRSRACKVLESTNPNPSTNGYSRVVSWIDNESSGIVHADAFDAKGKLLKEFDPKEFKKVNGQWQLQEMEIRNVQTKSRTRIEFDLAGK